MTRRFTELFLSCTIISSIVTVLNILGFLSNKNDLLLGTLCGTAVFVCINVRMLRYYYFDLNGNIVYFVANIAAYLIFTAVCLLIYRFCSSAAYAWLFGITKFGRYTNAELETFRCALIFHGIGFLMNFLAPWGMKEILKLKHE